MRPPELVGRQSEVDFVNLMIAKSMQRRNDGGLIMYGLRGVGKTVLLNELQQLVGRAGWVTVQLEARPGQSGRLAVRQSLGRGIAMAGRQMARFRSAVEEVKTAISTISAFSFTVAGASMNLGVDRSDHRANSGLLEVDLEELVADLAEPLRKNNSALAIFVDEMQDLDVDLLTALLAVQHRAVQSDWPFFIIGAGLSTLRRTLAEAHSYAERFTIREVGALPDEEARAAVRNPATALGAKISDDALEAILGEAQGYPFFLQTFGKAVWDIAPDRNIDREIAVAGIAEGNADLDQSFFPARWDRTTPGERQYLRAMVDVGGGDMASTSAIAEQLGTAATSLSPVRQSLIEKGIIYAERRGYVSFTVPNMDRFIRRQADVDE